jgi:type IV pilus secretin PilQ/predicted competence protein
MLTRLTQSLCGAAALLIATSVSQAQVSTDAPAPLSKPLETAPAAPAANVAAKPATTGVPDNTSMMLVQANTATVAPAANTTTTTTTGTAVDASTSTALATEPVGETGGVGVREFQGDEVGQVLRLLARQAKINMVVSDQIPPATTVTMRLEDVTALQAVEIIVKAKGLFMDKIDNVYYIKTAAERGAEPTESDSYQFSYARAKEISPLIAAQLQSKDAPQVDERTNTMFFRETRSNIDEVRKLLVQVDKPTKQVMIEARLVEVNANPRQSYGINWSGVVGSGSAPQTLKFAGTTPASFKVDDQGNPVLEKLPSYELDQNGRLKGTDFLRDARTGLAALAGQFAILSLPQLSVTLSALNEDADAEFLANPRVVTADNMQAKIEITRNQPVPKLNFNEQTATAVFGGFEDKKFGNTLLVKPLINKDDFITLSVKPEISNKVFDQAFTFAGATVTSPVIDTRSLESNVLIKSGDTLAIGGLMQDEVSKGRTKVPVLGDVPVLGYLFQSRTNARTKRNLLVFVTPTIIDQRYGTGLEDQVSGVRHSGEEFADPNGWRNNAKGAVRLVPTSHRQLAADYPKPGIPPAPARSKTSSRVQFMADAKDREY